MVLCLEMPLFWEEYLHDKSVGGRWFSIFTVLLPTIALVGRFLIMLLAD
jgi:hypothetical protein